MYKVDKTSNAAHLTQEALVFRQGQFTNGGSHES